MGRFIDGLAVAGEVGHTPERFIVIDGEGLLTQTIRTMSPRGPPRCLDIATLGVCEMPGTFGAGSFL